MYVFWTKQIPSIKIESTDTSKHLKQPLCYFSFFFPLDNYFSSLNVFLIFQANKSL